MSTTRKKAPTRRPTKRASKMSTRSKVAAPILNEETDSMKLYLHILAEVNKKKRPVDDRDNSIHPSYSKFQVPYFMVCRDRYHDAMRMYEEQFQHEINLLMENQSSAYEAARLNRHLSISTLWPPLHNRTEIEHTQRYFFRLSSRQNRRLNYLMSTKII